MKNSRTIFILFVALLALLGLTKSASADWDPSMPFKWLQEPDLTTQGMDVHVSVPYHLADDFRCTVTGPIDGIHIWGSWRGDILPDPGPAAIAFRLSIYSDIPASQSPTGYSMPGEQLWTRVFQPGEFTARVYKPEILEGWLTPPEEYLFPGDKVCWQYNFKLREGEFTQHGSPGKPIVYWLYVQAHPLDTRAVFGWKSSVNHWNDDAVWDIGSELPRRWKELVYPPRHPLEGKSVDLAFVITGHEQPPVHELGDAPDSSNSFPGVPMTAYPAGGFPGITAHFPTVYNIGSPPHGPIHKQPLAVAFLGGAVTLENEADIGLDQDGVNNLDVANDKPDRDKADDGVIFPLILPHCRPTQFDYVVNFVNFPPTQNLYVNVWYDWNRDGDWDDVLDCGQNPPAQEWAVQNQALNFMVPGIYTVKSLPFVSWHPAGTVNPLPIWMRITLSETRWTPPTSGLGSGGSGPATGYEFGETEDYYIEEYGTELDFGDAPDTAAAAGYPTLLGNNGARHIIVPGVMLGKLIDPENNGQPTPPADGDDLNNLDDEDGVVFLTPIVPGEPAVVAVTASVPGVLNTWIDYDADGNWAQPKDHVFINQPLAAGLNSLTFHVPASANPNVKTYARFRFTTPNMVGIGYAGLAPNGEVEDYQVEIAEPRVKWAQPPVYSPDSPAPKCFWGWDEFSVYGERQIVADDWLCRDNQPITDIHWWGSYDGWTEDVPPANNAPAAFHIGIWTDVPATPDSPSHPGVMLWEWFTETKQLSERPVGCDFYPPYMQKPDTCFRYDLVLQEKEWFFQKPDTTGTQGTVYWLSISAIYPGPLMPPYANIWGWKTRPHYFNDDAVKIFYPTKPAVGDKFREGTPIHTPDGLSWDMAFVLTTRDCMKYTAPEYLEWVGGTLTLPWNKPDCWCYQYQCRGDADGKPLSPVVPIQVTLYDLNILRKAINKMTTAADWPIGGECADFDHKALSPIVPIRVTLNDLNILRHFINKMNIPPCDQSNYNFWLEP